MTYHDHLPCCTSCGGKGGNCWDCRGTGHPHPTPQPTTHPVYTHPSGDKCIWFDDPPEWFVPLDVGGEGYTCGLPHPTDHLVEKINLVKALHSEQIVTVAYNGGAPKSTTRCKVCREPYPCKTLEALI